MTLDPPVFSPDNDGKDDLLHILCNPGEPGFLATVTIYDSRGRMIRQVTGNELIPTEGAFTWDGETDSRALAPAGIYIIRVELVNPDGRVMEFKKTAVLAVRS
jgi:flagellar hook assembly protein FlgD